MDTWPTTDWSSAIAMGAICATIDGPLPERRLVIECEKNAIGRYLVIQIDDVDSVLALCEVKVFVHGKFVQRKWSFVYFTICILQHLSMSFTLLFPWQRLSITVEHGLVFHVPVSYSSCWKESLWRLERQCHHNRLKHSRRVVDTLAVTISYELCFRYPGDDVASDVHVMDVMLSTSGDSKNLESGSRKQHYCFRKISCTIGEFVRAFLAIELSFSSSISSEAHFTSCARV